MEKLLCLDADGNRLSSGRAPWALHHHSRADSCFSPAFHRPFCLAFTPFCPLPLLPHLRTIPNMRSFRFCLTCLPHPPPLSSVDNSMQAVVARERAALISKHGRNDIDVPDLVMHPCTRMCSCRLNFVTPFTTGALVLPLLCLRF